MEKKTQGSGAPLLDLSQFEPKPKTDDEILGRLEPERPEWRHWLKMTAVTIKEALWLSVDIEPRSMGKHAYFGHVSGAFVEIKDYYGRLQVIQSALLCKELNFIRLGENFIDGMVKLADFVEWAASVGYEMPEELRGIPDKRQSSFNDTKPAYLDESHPMFSRELSIAIEAWGQVLANNPPKQKNGSRKKLIMDWLEKHHKNHLSGQAIERIATMLNPDGNGGAPPTD